jgi:hypothetical protein
MNKITSSKVLASAAFIALTVAAAPAAAFASGSGSSGGGNSSGGATPACATVALLPFYNFGNGGNQRLVVQGNVTNCGASAAVYTMVATEVGAHIDPLCAIKSTSYRLPSVASGAVQYWWQASGSGVCLNEQYKIRVDVMAGNTLLTSSTQTWG